MKLVKDTKRDFQIIDNPEKIKYILEEYTSYQNLMLKGTFPAVPVIFQEVNEEMGTITFQVPEKVDVSRNFSIYCTLTKQIEFEFIIIDRKKDIITANYTLAKIAKSNRKQKRYAIVDESVYGSHFQISKNKIDMNPNMPNVSNKVIFYEFQRSWENKFSKIQIKDLSENTQESNAIKKTCKPIFVVNTLDEKSYKAPNEHFICMSTLLGENLKTKILHCKDTGSKSLIYMPILYENLAGHKFVIGFIEVESTDRHLTNEDFKKIRTLSHTIVEKIKDANTVKFDIKQKINNISEEGAALLIEEAELGMYLTQRNSIVFDIIFQMQAPIRLFAAIKYVLEKDKGVFVVGLSFEGKAFTKFQNNLKQNIKELIVKSA